MIDLEVEDGAIEETYSIQEYSDLSGIHFINFIIRSLNKNYYELLFLLQDLGTNFHFIELNETWEIKIECFNIPGYDIFCNNSRLIQNY